MSFGDKITVFFSWIWEFILPFLKVLLRKAGKALAEAALAAVIAVKDYYLATDGTNDEKRAMAFKLIVEKLKSRGITGGTEITTSMINAAIEMALQKLKEE